MYKTATVTTKSVPEGRQLEWIYWKEDFEIVERIREFAWQMKLEVPSSSPAYVYWKGYHEACLVIAKEINRQKRQLRRETR